MAQTILSPEDKKKVQEALDAQRAQQEKDAKEAEMRNLILDAQRQQPGYRYC